MDSTPHKQSFYISHDLNAFSDPKIRYIVGRHGVWAYAAYWVIIELMADQPGCWIRKDGFVEGMFPLLQGGPIRHDHDMDNHYKFLLKQNSLEGEERISSEEAGRHCIDMETIVQLFWDMLDIGLLYQEGDYISSRSLQKRAAKRLEISKIRAKSGKKGGEANAEQTSDGLLKQKSDSLEANATQERKRKEKKKNLKKDSPPTPPRGESDQKPELKIPENGRSRAKHPPRTIGNVINHTFPNLEARNE